MEDKERMLGIKDIMNAVEITLYSDTVLYIVDENDDAYGFHKIEKNGFINKIIMIILIHP